MKNHFLPIIFLCFWINSYSQNELLQSGPMVGYSTMKEAALWVQTKSSAKVYFEYWDKALPQKKYKTDPIQTTKIDAYTATALADQLEPGIHYEYRLFINDKKVARPYRLEFESQPIWLWRTDAPDFSFATGSGTYINEPKYDRPGTPYGADYQIFTNIHKKDPDFMLWLGDNTYLREADWNSSTGIRYRQTHTRSNAEMQAMLGSMHNYAIWDDHDYGPNNSDRSYHMKRETERVFKLFFPSTNYIFDEGTTSYFQWADCEFFLMDNRYWRTPNKRRDIKDHDILGDDQIEWLLDALVNSYAPFKFVVMGGQFLSTIERGESYYNCAPQERQKIIDAIKRLKINGVIFLSGDIHSTELSKLDLEGGYPLYDLTVSPFTSGIHKKEAEKNTLFIEGSQIIERNYAKIDVLGTRKERTLKIQIYNSDGEELWTKNIMANDLKFPRNEKN